MLIRERKAADERTNSNRGSRAGLVAVNHQHVYYQRDEQVVQSEYFRCHIVLPHERRKGAREACRESRRASRQVELPVGVLGGSGEFVNYQGDESRRNGSKHARCDIDQVCWW